MSVTFTTATADYKPVGVDEWGEPIEELDAPWVNLSNANAWRIIQLLGYTVEGTGELFNTGDIYGSAAGEEFLGRVLVALAIEPTDEGTDTETFGGPGTDQATWIECGRRPGYTQERLKQLREVAEAAKAAGVPVVWS